jgi:hypothetical protein
MGRPAHRISPKRRIMEKIVGTGNVRLGKGREKYRVAQDMIHYLIY